MVFLKKLIQFCDVGIAQTGNHPEEDLAKSGYRPDMKVVFEKESFYILAACWNQPPASMFCLKSFLLSEWKFPHEYDNKRSVHNLDASLRYMQKHESKTVIEYFVLHLLMSLIGFSWRQVEPYGARCNNAHTCKMCVTLL